MWLDRIAGHHSAPAGAPHNGRSYSPSPRRPAQRPGIGPRQSSLSVLLTPNDSTTSLPGNARLSNLSTLRNGAASHRLADISDPIDVLDKILERKEKGYSRDTGELSTDVVEDEHPAQLVENIDFGQLSLQGFVEQQTGPRRILQSDAGMQAVQQFEKERDRFQDLHTAITGCDEVSQSVELYLNDFQTELGAVSAEIESLQSRSVQLSAMLENRRNVERLLGPAVEEISISPKAVRLIAEGPIDENWVKALNEIEVRSASIEAKALGSTQVLEDVQPLLSNIKNKATERIRDYLVAQIKAFRSPNINAQIIQQQRLVKFRDLYSYILKAHPALTAEITQAYINTMRWYYLSNFTRYLQSLEKIKLYPNDRNDILGGDASSPRPGNHPSGNRTAAASHDPFSLGRRIDILRTSNHMAISSYLAEEDKSFHGVEVPFRNFNIALVDNASAEYSFMTEMFASMPLQEISRRASEVFEPVLALGQTLTKQLIENTHDCLGILICVRLNQQAAFELQRRKVPLLDAYVNRTNMQLWPRFQVVMDVQCDSLKRVASNAGRGAMSALSLTGAADDSRLSAAPHFLTQRFGQLLHGILALSSETGDDEPVSNSLARLVAEFDMVLAKLSRSSGDAKRRERFLFNNYSLILTIVSDTQGKLATEQKQHFDEMLKNLGRQG